MTLPKSFVFGRQERGIFRRCKPWNTHRPYRGQFGCKDKKCRYIDRCEKYEYLCKTWRW